MSIPVNPLNSQFTTTQSTSAAYRPEIDGLRAVAIIPVIFYHAGFASFTGGFVGVDVFFVISGYLITSLIVRDLEQGCFSLAHFYERRARRILPALFLVLLVSFPLAWVWLDARPMLEYSRSLLSVLVFASNFMFWFETGYFDSAIELKPLIHTWSLAIEEQYYLLYPLLLLLVWRFKPKAIAGVLVALSVASLSLAVIGSSQFPDAAFYLLPTRAWELLLGALTAFWLSNGNRAPRHTALSDLLSATGLLCIVIAVLKFSAATAFPGYAALLPTLGTVLIIAFSGHARYIKALLSLRLLVGIGLISYSAYLWHQPLLAILRHASLNDPDLAMLGMVIIGTFILSWISWRFVEQPFRNNRDWPGSRAKIAMVLSVLTLYGLGIYGTGDGGLLSRFDRLATVLDSYYPEPERPDNPGPACRMSGTNMLARLDNCDSVRAGRYALLIGDSHASALASALRDELLAHDLDLISLYNNGCLPIQGTQGSTSGNGSECETFLEDLDAAMQTLEPEFIVYAARWAVYINGTFFDNREGGAEYPNRTVDIRVSGTSATTLSRHIAEQVNLIAQQTPVIFVHQIPEAGWDVRRRIMLLERRFLAADSISTSADLFSSRNAYQSELDSLFAETVATVAPAALVCDTVISGRCANILDHKALYTDDDHPSYYFARLIAGQITEAARQQIQ